MRYEDYLKQRMKQSVNEAGRAAARSLNRAFRGSIHSAAHAAADLSRRKRVHPKKLVRAAAQAVIYRLYGAK